MGMKIVKTAVALPLESFSNDDIIKKYELDSSSEWVVQMTGIESRGFFKNDQDFINACFSVFDSLKDVGLIDGIVVASSTSPYSFPGLSHIIHSKSGLPSIRLLDVNAACNGFMQALSVAHSWLEFEGLNRVLVIGADMMSKILDFKDRSTAFLFADAVGGVIVEKSDAVKTYWNHFNESINYEALVASDSIKMNGRAVFEKAVKVFEGMVLNLLDNSKLCADDINFIIPHQANYRIFKSLANRLKIDESKIPFLASNIGNTSAATIPVAINSLLEKEDFLNSKYILAGFGAGFSASAALFS